MRFAWIGFHHEGVPALEALLDAGAPIAGVLTLRPDLAAKRSGGADYFQVCARRGVPLHYICDVNDAESKRILEMLQPDVVFVLGWHQIIRPDALGIATIGMIGAHASLLPHNRGSAPINWAIINGERETGNSLIWLAPDVDAGAIIDQTAFPITPHDTCATLYQRVADSNRDMLLRVLPRLMAGERPGRPQPHTDEPVLHRRRPKDGLVQWERSGGQVYDFIRALTRPYPGAFSGLDGVQWKIWQAALAPEKSNGHQPGRILGPVLSPSDEANGQLVACGEGAVILLEIESSDGTVLKGKQLSQQDWAGKQWHHD